MTEQTAELSNSQELPEPGTDKPWLWHKGQPSANPYGRAGNPEKRTVITELKRIAEKRSAHIAAALVKSAESGNTRAFIALRDTVYGVPKQSLVIERADDPLTRWIQGMTGMGTIDTAIDPVNDLPALPPPTND